MSETENVAAAPLSAEEIAEAIEMAIVNIAQADLALRVADNAYTQAQLNQETAHSIHTEACKRLNKLRYQQRDIILAKHGLVPEKCF